MAITNGYATLADVKSSLRVFDSIDDNLLNTAIESASRLIDGYAARTFYNEGSATRDFAATDWQVCNIDDLQSLTSLQTTDEVGGVYETWELPEYQLEPVNQKVDGLYTPYTRIIATDDKVFYAYGSEALVRVTGVWGWPTVPTAIKQATIIQASRLYKRLDSPLGVAGFGDLGAIRIGRALDPDVEQLVIPYRIMRHFA